MKITPSPYLLESVRSSNLGWKLALGELIDNAIDASATSVVILAEANRLVITDDGTGCSDIEAMFRLGDHRPHQKRGLGRYGIGLKDAALWLWGETRVVSVHGGRSYSAIVDWGKLLRSPEWEVGDPVVAIARNEMPGTRLVFSRTEKRFPSGKELEALVSDLGFVFSPGLKSGVRITIRRDKSQPMQCVRTEAPPLENVITGAVEVEGRTAEVHVGIVPEGSPNPRSGLHYTHRHRVIMPSTGLGCGETSTARIFGWVRLGDQWRLSKNKDDVAEFKAELGAAVYALIRPALEVAAQQADSIELSGLEAELTERLRETVSGPKKDRDERTQRERRDNTGESVGTVEPKHTGRVRGAIKRQPGNKLPGRIEAGKLRVEFKELEDRDGIGLVDDHSSRVTLAINHPYVATLRADNDREPLFQLVLSLLLHHCVMFDESGQRLLPGITAIEQARQFSVMLGRYMGEVIALPKEVRS